MLFRSDGWFYNKWASWVNEENFPILLNLKGHDGKALIDQERFRYIFSSWFEREKKPNRIQRVFDSIKDENGNLPFLRESFDFFLIGTYNTLLNNTKFEYQESRSKKEKQVALTKLNMLMGWKDKDGLPVVDTDSMRYISRDIREIECACSKNEIEFADVLESYIKSRENGNTLKIVIKNAQSKRKVLKSTKRDAKTRH